MLGNPQVRFGGGQTKKEPQCHLVGWLPTFDHINQAVVLDKLQTYPALRQAINGWLKAGVMDGETYSPSKMCIAQGGVLSPLLMNIALHGMEAVAREGDSGPSCDCHGGSKLPMVDA